MYCMNDPKFLIELIYLSFLSMQKVNQLEDKKKQDAGIELTSSDACPFCFSSSAIDIGYHGTVQVDDEPPPSWRQWLKSINESL